jgi:hypothetical protein
MSKTKVFMAIPSTGQREDYHTYMFEEWRRRYSDEIEFVFPDGCQQYFGHDYARNMYVERFLESDCDVMFFIDSDVCPPQHVFDLITVHGDKGWLAAGAPYPLWLYRPGTTEMSVQYTVYKGNAKAENGNAGLKMVAVPQEGTDWVDGLATGCLMLRRELFEKLEKPYFQFKRDPNTCEVKEGEDLGFALKLQKLGIQYFVDYGMVCGHMKRVNLLEVQNYATAMSNEKLLAYDRMIRPQIEEAVQAAAKQGAMQGYRQGKEDALTSNVPPRTKSGLILPSQL